MKLFGIYDSININPGTIILAFILVLIFIGISIRIAKRSHYPYIRRGKLFTATEKNFLNALEAAVGEDYRIFGQVRIADILLVKNGLSASNRQTYFNKISAKHVDFVLCNRDDLTVVCAIELDDRSHQARNRMDRDDFINKAFLAAQLPLVRFKARNRYQPLEIRTRLEGIEIQTGKTNKKDSKQPACPRCSSDMVQRKSKTGKNAGKLFWGCSKFPQCKGIISIN